MSVPVPPAPEPTPTAQVEQTTVGGDGDGGAGSSGGPTLRERIAGAVSVAPPRPGTMVRLKYASYLFCALLFCMMFRGVVSKLFGDIPYYREACAVDHKAVVPSAPTTTSAAASTPAPPPPSGFLPHITLPNGLPGEEVIQKIFSDSCLEATVVYRLSFSLFLFFVLHFCSVSDLTCCIEDSVRDEMQSGYFGFKTMILVVLNFVAFAMPTRFFAFYAWACMYASALFLVIQIILIVDFAHEWNEEWGDRGDTNEKWMYYLVIITILCFVSGIGLTGYGFTHFTPHEDCNLHGFLLIANVMLGIICAGIAVWVPHGSLLPTSILFSYTSFLIVSALRTSPDTRCGGIPGGDLETQHTSWWSMLLTSMMTAGALAYTASSVGGSDESFDIGTSNNDDHDAGGEGGRRSAGEFLGHLPSYLYFYAIMALASMYLAMVGTDWTISGTENGKAGGAEVSFWAKVVSSWLTYAVYFWSLLAPYFCCKHRDFGYDVPDEW